MRYFTKAMWAGWQEPGGFTEATTRAWDELLADYRQQAEGLRDRVPPAAFEFFLEAPTHDGQLRSFCIEQRSAGTWDGSPEGEYPIGIELIMEEQSGVAWRLSYGSVRQVIADYPSSQPLFLIGGEGLGDWGYDELTDAGDGFLRHEVLFATGATLLVEFRTVEASKIAPISAG